MKVMIAVFALALGVIIAVQNASAATRVYFMRGLLELSPGMQDMAAAVRHRGGIATVGSWMQRSEFVADALRHPHDHIVLAGHSMGAKEAAVGVNQLRAAGINARMVGIDPLCTSPPAIPKGAGVNFVGNGCGMISPYITGARNVDISRFGLSHIGMPADPRVQRLVVNAAMGG